MTLYATYHIITIVVVSIVPFLSAFTSLYYCTTLCRYAPECLRNLRFTTKGDVWSYAMGSLCGRCSVTGNYPPRYWVELSKIPASPALKKVGAITHYNHTPYSAKILMHLLVFNCCALTKLCTYKCTSRYNYDIMFCRVDCLYGWSLICFRLHTGNFNLWMSVEYRKSCTPKTYSLDYTL